MFSLSSFCTTPLICLQNIVTLTFNIDTHTHTRTLKNLALSVRFKGDMATRMVNLVKIFNFSLSLFFFNHQIIFYNMGQYYNKISHTSEEKKTLCKCNVVKNYKKIGHQKMQVLQLSLSTVPSSQHHHKEERSEHIVATMVHIFSEKLNQLPSDFCFLSVDIIIFLVLFSQFLFSVQLLSSLCHFTTSKNITIVFLFFFFVHAS